MNYIIDKILPPFAALLFFAAIILIGWFIYGEWTAERYSLKKSDWECTKDHTEPIFISDGKGGGFYGASSVCDRYERK